MWKKGGGRFARVPGKSSVAALIGNVVFNINSPFFFPKETKLHGLDFFFFLDSSNQVAVFSLPYVPSET